MCTCLRKWSWPERDKVVIIIKNWFYSVCRLHCTFYSSQANFLGMHTNQNNPSSDYLFGLSTGKIQSSMNEIWHRESHLHCKIYPSWTNFFGTFTIFDLCWKHRVLARLQFVAFYVCLFVRLYLCMYFWSGGKVFRNKRWTRDDEHPSTFHMGVHRRGIYVALCGTNQIEATKLRGHSTNERAG